MYTRLHLARLTARVLVLIFFSIVLISCLLLVDPVLASLLLMCCRLIDTLILLNQMTEGGLMMVVGADRSPRLDWPCSESAVVEDVDFGWTR